MCARCHYQYIRGAQRGLHWLAGPPQGSKMKQASIGRFFTKPNGPKASNKAPTSVQANGGNREALKTVNSLEKKRVREVTPRSKKTTCSSCHDIYSQKDAILQVIVTNIRMNTSFAHQMPLTSHPRCGTAWCNPVHALHLLRCRRLGMQVMPAHVPGPTTTLQEDGGVGGTGGRLKRLRKVDGSNKATSAAGAQVCPFHTALDCPETSTVVLGCQGFCFVESLTWHVCSWQAASAFHELEDEIDEPSENQEVWRTSATD